MCDFLRHSCVVILRGCSKAACSENVVTLPSRTICQPHRAGCFWCAVWNGAAPFEVATRQSLDLRQSNHALAGGNRTPSSADVYRESRTADLPEGAPVEANEASQAIGACTACGRVYGDRMRLFLRGSVALSLPSTALRCVVPSYEKSETFLCLRCLLFLLGGGALIRRWLVS